LDLKTKQKIIVQAIAAYNANGVTNVTSRDLADSLGISHGNLEYHFKNKEVLLMAIYKQMRNDISEVYEEKGMNRDPFEHFNELLMKLEHFHDKYSFFNLDVLEISRNFKKVDNLLKKTFQIRREQMALFFRRFMDYGYFKAEIKEGHYMRLQHTIRIIITFWKSQNEVLPYSAFTANSNMTTYVWELLLPHMTSKGFLAYENLTPILNKK
jgi:AcrR family transcriptional regulator